MLHCCQFRLGKVPCWKQQRALPPRIPHRLDAHLAPGSTVATNLEPMRIIIRGGELIVKLYLGPPFLISFSSVTKRGTII